MASGAMCSGTPPFQVLTLAPLASLQDARGITRRRSGPGAPENPNYLNIIFVKLLWIAICSRVENPTCVC